MTRRVVTEGAPRCEGCRFSPRWCICEGFRALALPLGIDVLIHRREFWRPTSTGRLINRVIPASHGHVFRHAGVSEAVLPRELAGSEHVYHLYAVRLRGRDGIQRALARQGIATQVAYPSTLPSQPALARYRKGRFPKAEQATRQILALPMYPELAPPLIERVVRAVARAL